MQQWTIEAPEQLTFGPVEALDVRIVAGQLTVLASEGPPTLEVAEIESASPLMPGTACSAGCGATGAGPC
jgi:hypothetical protein